MNTETWAKPLRWRKSKDLECRINTNNRINNLPELLMSTSTYCLDLSDWEDNVRILSEAEIVVYLRTQIYQQSLQQEDNFGLVCLREYVGGDQLGLMDNCSHKYEWEAPMDLLTTKKVLAVVGESGISDTQ